MDGCLDDEAFAAYVDGGLPPDEVARVDAHIDGCATCRADLSAIIVVADGSVPTVREKPLLAGEAPELGPGDQVGRYVVVHEHARGGMGVVALAHDPELGRKVALKVLRDEQPGEELRDEARAMASLSHPNVVAVHDVGIHAGRIFLAMELVDGVTLRAWLAIEQRPWRQILAACLAAGRGLAAAHRAGIVHRDIKPDNVLCGPGDRVRVTDFGLARHDGVATGSSQRTGIAGTPYYMAPEIWRGEPATPRSDQWSFCVMLCEALTGARPFDGEDEDAIGAAVQRGTLTLPTGLPKRVSRAVTRGLRLDPAERFPSLDALVDELQRAQARRVVPWALAGAAVLVAGVVAVAARDDERPELCAMPASLLDGVWDAGQRETIGVAFAASGRKHGPETARRVTAILDGYGERWLAARADACVATRVRGDQSDAVLDARTRCLDRRSAELAALVHVLTDHPTTAVVDRAVQATHELQPVDTCSVVGVRTEDPLPAVPETAAAVVALDRDLATIRASQLIGKTEALEARLRTIIERARSLGYAPVIARATQQLAELAVFATDHAAAERSLFAALDAAAKAKNDRLTALAWIDLVTFSAMQRGDAALALTYARTAEVAIVRADSPRELRGAFFHAKGVALAMQGNYEEARASFERSLTDATGALEIATTSSALCNVELELGKVSEAAAHCEGAVAGIERELGPDHPTLGFTVLNAGNVALEQRDLARAGAAFRRALAILADTVGERHIAYALALNNLGIIEQSTNDLAGAERDLLRARDLLDGLKHPDAFLPRFNLGRIERTRGHHDKARQLWQEALAIAEGSHGKDSDRAAQIWHNLGALAVDQGRLDEAQQAYTRSLEMAEQLFGDTHPQTAAALDGLGFVFVARNDCRRAVIYFRRAVTINEAVYGADHPHVAETLTSLAECQLRLGDRAALPSLERALVIHDAHPEGPPFEPAATRWTLAQALARFRGDHARAVLLATEARKLYATSPEVEAAAVLPEIDRWLAAKSR